MDELEKARRVKRSEEDGWLAVDGVTAVGIGQLDDGKPAIIVSVESDTERIRRQIPHQVEGVPVEIRITGPIRPM